MKILCNQLPHPFLCPFLAYCIITLLIDFVYIDLPGVVGMPAVSEIRSTYVVVTWTLPSPDGGNPSTHYNIEQRLVSLFGSSLVQDDTSWISVNTSNSLMSHVASLSPYTGYQFRVMAENVAGSGPPSLSSMVAVTLEAGRYVNLYVLVCYCHPCPLM